MVSIYHIAGHGAKDTVFMLKQTVKLCRFPEL